MFIQNKEGLYVYKYNLTIQKIELKSRYNNFSEFAFSFRNYVHNISYLFGTNIYEKLIDFDKLTYSELYVFKKFFPDMLYGNHKMILADSNGRIYHPSVIRAKILEHINDIKRYSEYKNKRALHNHRVSRRKPAYGSFRYIKTTQERRMSLAFDEENFVKCRSSRTDANLPNSWDDIDSHNDKSWKTQSKRKHQWKPK